MDGSNRRFELVHSMRGVAAISVLLYHALFKVYLKTHPDNPLTPYAAHLDVGVSIFFLISGFVLYRPMVAARLAGERPIDTEAYAWRRLYRIVPAYWAALALAGLAGASYIGYPTIFSADGIPAYFGFLQIYSPDTAAGGINVAWTLCVELTFYAFLPFWALLLRRISPQGGVRSEFAGLALLFAASFAWQVVAVQSTNVNMFGERWLEPLPNFLDQFAVGMALAVASVAVQRRRVPTWTCLLAAALAYVALATLIGSHSLTPGRYLLRHQLNTMVALGVLAPAIFVARERRRRLPALAFLGTVSYGIYLYHVPVMVRLAKWYGLPRNAAELALWLTVTIVTVVILAALSWRLVERPLIGRQRRTATGQPTLPASSTARSETERALAGTGIA